MLLTALTALLFGLVPALSASGDHSAQALRSEGHGAGTSIRSGRLRDVLVIAETALAVLLLAGAGLMLRSVSRLVHVNPGVDVNRVISGRVALRGPRYSAPDDRVRFFTRLTANLRAVPGVERAAAASYVPAGARGFGLGRVFLRDGQPEPPGSSDFPASWNVVTPEFFETVGMRVVRGRGFSDHDRAESLPVMIINETMARKVFGAADPIGQRMRSWRDENILRQIVGVVADVKYDGLADEARSLVYVPHRQNAWGLMIVVVRAAGNPAALAEPLRREVARIDGDVAVGEVATLATQAAASIATSDSPACSSGFLPPRPRCSRPWAFTASCRTPSFDVQREMGVRLALGARPASVFALVVQAWGRAHGGRDCPGMAGAAAAGRVMRSLLFGISATDPVTFASVPVLLGAVALSPARCRRCGRPGSSRSRRCAASERRAHPVARLGGRAYDRHLPCIAVVLSGTGARYWRRS